MIWYGGKRAVTPRGDRSLRIGLAAELYAERFILPKEGFSEIVNLSRQFTYCLFDYVARKDGQRVVVDITTRVAAVIRKKIEFARVLGLPLFIVHVCPSDGKTYYVAKIEGSNVSSHVPPDVLDAIAYRHGLDPKAPDLGLGESVFDLESNRVN